MDPAPAPIVSVCIPNYNGIGVIESCIESVLGQIGDLAVEIIVHDDCSIDGSADLVARRYPRVKLIRSAENVGFCVSNNRMVAKARGRYLLLLNNDAALFPGAIATLHQAANLMLRPAILTLPQYDAETDALIDIGCLLDPFLNPVPNLDPTRKDVGMVIGACLWIPKVLWQELGGFPEWFGSIGEDLYLCCRARLAGHAVRALGDSGYRHRIGKSFGGGRVTNESRLVTTYRRRALSERNKNFVMITCYPQTLLMILLPMHGALLLFEGMVMSLLRWEVRPLSEIYIPALSACWHERRRLRTLRGEVQQGRRSGLGTFLSAFRVLPHKLAMLLRYGMPSLS